MKPLIAFVIGLSLGFPANAQTKCTVSGEPLLWIMKYCSLTTGVTDEIEVQSTPCFKAANSDLTQERCAVNEKYKRQSCEILIEKLKKHASVQACIADSSVKSFVISDE